MFAQSENRDLLLTVQGLPEQEFFREEDLVPFWFICSFAHHVLPGTSKLLADGQLEIRRIPPHGEPKCGLADVERGDWRPPKPDLQFSPPPGLEPQTFRFATI